MKNLIKISDITSSGFHGLEVFSSDEIKNIEKESFYKKGKPYIKCFVSGVDRPLKPEEIVRQLYCRKLVNEYSLST